MVGLRQHVALVLLVKWDYIKLVPRRTFISSHNNGKFLFAAQMQGLPALAAKLNVGQQPYQSPITSNILARRTKQCGGGVPLAILHLSASIKFSGHSNFVTRDSLEVLRGSQ